MPTPPRCRVAVVGVFFIPVFYVMLQRVSEPSVAVLREERETPAADVGANGPNMNSSISNGQSAGNHALALLLCRVVVRLHGRARLPAP